MYAKPGRTPTYDESRGRHTFLYWDDEEDEWTPWPIHTFRWTRDTSEVVEWTAGGWEALLVQMELFDDS